jgi:hypothetical protein
MQSCGVLRRSATSVAHGDEGGPVVELVVQRDHPTILALPHFDIGGEFGTTQLGHERVQLREGRVPRLRLRFVRQPSQ